MVAKPSPLYSTLSSALIDFQLHWRKKAHEKNAFGARNCKVHNVVANSPFEIQLKGIGRLDIFISVMEKRIAHFNAMERTPKSCRKATVSRNRWGNSAKFLPRKLLLDSEADELSSTLLGMKQWCFFRSEMQPACRWHSLKRRNKRKSRLAAL